jgi:hypothetical protein
MSGVMFSGEKISGDAAGDPRRRIIIKKNEKQKAFRLSDL